MSLMGHLFSALTRFDPDLQIEISVRSEALRGRFAQLTCVHHGETFWATFDLDDLADMEYQRQIADTLDERFKGAVAKLRAAIAEHQGVTPPGPAERKET